MRVKTYNSPRKTNPKVDKNPKNSNILNKSKACKNRELWFLQQTGKGITGLNTKESTGDTYEGNHKGRKWGKTRPGEEKTIKQETKQALA